MMFFNHSLNASAYRSFGPGWVVFVWRFAHHDRGGARKYLQVSRRSIQPPCMYELSLSLLCGLTLSQRMKRASGGGVQGGVVCTKSHFVAPLGHISTAVHVLCGVSAIISQVFLPTSPSRPCPAQPRRDCVLPPRNKCLRRVYSCFCNLTCPPARRPSVLPSDALLLFPLQ